MVHDAVLDVFFPYCLKRLADGRYILLNRGYNPLGVGGGRADYKTHPSATALDGITPEVAALLSFNGDTSIDNIYLFNDGTKPVEGNDHWDAYAKRLRVLSELLIPAT